MRSADGCRAFRRHGLGLPVPDPGVHALRRTGIPGARGVGVFPDPDPAAPHAEVILDCAHRPVTVGGPFQEAISPWLI